MTGCPNGCVRPYQSDIGIVGRSGDKYTLFVGGNVARRPAQLRAEGPGARGRNRADAAVGLGTLPRGPPARRKVSAITAQRVGIDRLRQLVGADHAANRLSRRLFKPRSATACASPAYGFRSITALLRVEAEIVEQPFQPRLGPTAN